VQSIGSIAPYSNYSSIGRFNKPTIVTIVKSEETQTKLTKEQADRVMETVSDLIDDPAYKPFFFRKLYAIGPTDFIAFADQARKENFKCSRRFVNLLKQHAPSVEKSTL
jgi:hypothetical protein